MEKKTCPICGEPTSSYMGKYRKDGLCRMHGAQAKNDEIVQCFLCEKWHTADKDCECTKTKQTIEYNVPSPWTKQKNNEDKTINMDELTCIICNAPSNGKHFCYDCYRKYKDRAVDIRITNCRETEILDAYGNLQYKCDDGRKVRSKSEKIISDFLFKYGIRTIYEKAVYYYPNDNETITLHPDFYLPDYDYYIEHNGVDTKSYKANKAKTEEMYKALGYKVIVTTESDLGDIEAKLKPILRIN